MHLDIIFSQILGLSILVMVGIIGSKTGILSENAKDFLAKIIFNITLPLLLLCNFSKLNITPKLLSNSLNVIVLTFIVLFFMFLVSWLTIRLIRMSENEAAVFNTHSMFGNLVYLGFPVISALYGYEGLLYAGMFQLVSNLLLWTAGVLILSQKKNLNIGQRMKHIFNTNTIAILIGFTMFLFSVKIPSVLLKSLSGLGDSTTYLSMLYIGTMMYHSNLKGLMNNKEVYLLAVNKLIIVPVLIIMIFSVLYLFFQVRFDILVISVIVILASMPAMANVVVMAKIFNSDDKLATANVIVTSVFSLITLPLVILLLNFLLA